MGFLALCPEHPVPRGRSSSAWPQFVRPAAAGRRCAAGHADLCGRRRRTRRTRRRVSTCTRCERALYGRGDELCCHGVSCRCDGARYADGQRRPGRGSCPCPTRGAGRVPARPPFWASSACPASSVASSRLRLPPSSAAAPSNAKAHAPRAPASQPGLEIRPCRLRPSRHACGFRLSGCGRRRPVQRGLSPVHQRAGGTGRVHSTGRLEPARSAPSNPLFLLGSPSPHPPFFSPNFHLPFKMRLRCHRPQAEAPGPGSGAVSWGSFAHTPKFANLSHPFQKRLGFIIPQNLVS